MQKRKNIYVQTNKATAKSKQGKSMKILCMILCTLLLLGTCVGCTSYASVDEVSALKGSLDEALEEIDSINKEYAATLQELALLKGAQAEAEKALEELEADYANAQQEIELLGSSNQAARQQIDSLSESHAATKQELDLLKGSHQSAQEEISALQGAVDAAEEEIDSLKNDYDTAKQTIDTLQGTVDSMQKDMNSLQEKYDAAQQEIDNLKGQIEDLQNNLSPEEPIEKIKIYIDQGHNPTSYHNTGATGNGLYEQDVTFEIGILLAEFLKADGRFEVCLSRPTVSTVLGTDNDSSLDARVQGAKDFGADFFISLHINAYGESTANGIEVYVAEENSVSYDFGKCLLQGMLAFTNLRDRGMKLNPDLRVLKNATMPAALLEMGFISNPQDAALLAESPELFAQGIYNGILTYFKLSPNNSANQ